MALDIHTYDGTLWGADLIGRLSKYTTTVQDVSRVEAYPAISIKIGMIAKSIAYYTDNTYTRAKNSATYDPNSSTPNFAYANATTSINSGKTVDEVGGYYVFTNQSTGASTSGGLGDNYFNLINY